jgi:hypothetical protein
MGRDYDRYRNITSSKVKICRSIRGKKGDRIKMGILVEVWK